MRKPFLTALVLLCCALLTHSFAQTILFAGNITDESGKPIEGVSVAEKNSKKGTVTDATGFFKLSTRKGATIIFSSVGFEKMEISATPSVEPVSISLKTSQESLSEVVVTALGIKREKKALGYAVSTVAGKDVELRPEGDIGRLLSGKAPGLNVLNTSGISGSGTNIIIRAISTINGSASPLFIVDGVPFDNSTNANDNFQYGNQTSSRMLDLDPNNIESVSVLKGLSAATLYGDQAKNGVILITTKTGSSRKLNKKMQITASQSLFSNTVANLPDYTQKYGGGFDLAPSLAFSNWGAAFKSAPDSFTHPYDRATLNSVFPQYKGAKYAYKPYNSVKDFFRTGLVSTSSVNVVGGGPTASFNANYSYLDDEGFTPGNRIFKNNFGLGGSAKLDNHFTLSATVNYALTDYVSPVTSPSGGSSADVASVFGDLIYTPLSIDLMGLPYKNPVDGSSVYYRANNGIQNPRWTAENALAKEKVSRTYGNFQLKYDVMKGLSLAYRLGLDNYTEQQALTVNKGGVSGGPSYVNGLYRTITSNNSIVNHTFLASYNTDLSSDFNLNIDAGVESRHDFYEQSGLKSTQQLVFGLFDHSNFITHDIGSEGGGDLDYKRETRRLGVFVQGVLGYKEYLYLNFGGREGWISTLEKNNRSIFYPGVSASFIPTSAIEVLKNNKSINYLKVRAGYGSSASFPGPYNTRATYGITTNSFVDNKGNVVNAGGISDQVPNPNLKPELLKEFELGVEGRFFERVTVDLTLYKRISQNQILNQQLDPSSGYTNIQTNAGSVTNKGIELTLGYTVITSKDWKWQLDGNFNLNRSKVKDVPNGDDEHKPLIFAGYSNLGNAAINGKPLGVIVGSYIQRDAKTGLGIVDANGYYLSSSDVKIIGDPNPDYKLTGISTLSYKSFSLRAQVDYTKGGQMFSGTVRTLLARGVTKDTDFDRSLPYTIKNTVKQDGTKNDIQQSVNNIYFNALGFGPNETGIYDATVVRLREVSLSYSLPKSFISKTPFGGITIAVSGQNLWYYAPNFPKYTRFDPETSSINSSTSRGLEFLTGPSSRRIGVSLRVTL